MRLRPALALALAVALVATVAAGCAQAPKEQPRSVNVAAMAPPDMLTQLPSGSIDGFVAWEPFPSAAVAGGTGKVLLLSKDIWPGHPCCVLAATTSTVDPAIQEALVWAHIKATEWMNDPKNLDKLVAYGAEFTGKPADVIRMAYANIKYTDVPNAVGLKEYYDQLAKYKLLKKTPQDLGYASEDAFLGSFIDKSVYDAARAAKPADIAAAVAKSGGKVRITNITGDLHHIAKFVAVKEGFYQQAGLIPGKNLIEVASFPNGTAVMQAFANRQIDAAYLGGAPATLKRINDDTKITVIAGVNDLGSALVVGAKSGITTPEGLAGKTVAVPAPGTVQDVLLRRLLEKLGLAYVLKP